jgi:hypothetical protein
MSFKIFSLFITLSFLLSFLAEADDLHKFSKNNQNQMSNSSLFTAVSAITSQSCDDCQENGCKENQNHCSQHCSGIHSLVSTNSKVKLLNLSKLNDKITWSFYNHYKAPSLNPSLKPPTFS